MTKDFIYPEELVKSVQEKQLEDYMKQYEKYLKQDDEEYCECHERCPKCGRKYKQPMWISNTGT